MNTPASANAPHHEPELRARPDQSPTRGQAAEYALRETARRLEDAQRVAKIGSWELDLVSGALTWSNEIYRIFEIGADRFGASYLDFLALVHPEDRETVDKAYQVSLQRREPYDIEHRLLMPDGRVKWVHERCESEFDRGGRPLRSRGTVQDITQRKSVEEALRESEAAVAAFMHASPEAVIITDAATRIKLFSAGAETIFGYQADEVIGRDIECLMPERARAMHRHHVRAFNDLPVLGKMIDERSEITGLRKNGEEFPAEASLSKLKTPSGVSFAILLRDVTQQKLVRTELLNAKLAAESANEAKSRFIANMSHELRTPLNAIIGFSQILAESDVDSEKVQTYAKDIHDSGKHLLGIINDILQISRMDLGGLSLHEEDVCLDDLVKSCVRMVGDRAREAGLRVDIDLEHALPLLWVDRRLLAQAVLNLLTNAIKFTERDGAVTIGARRTANGGVAVYVRDTGIGMAPEDVARVGQPFMQADNRLARRYEGTGLGLVITKRLTELHDGVLTVESAIRLGTVVSICLPDSRVCGAAPQPICCGSAESVSKVT